VVGIHSFDLVRWQDHVALYEAAWIQRELKRAADSIK